MDMACNAQSESLLVGDQNAGNQHAFRAQLMSMAAISTSSLS